ncbi:hypothetical protein Cgig2_017059 [Carnegiea gigantea]|uniref:Reverse transcriptase domain-containing protein n=1 Tax=Carnegiea gigantea TaxID=171969 RepID=A0A9Q1JU26_9CARY|nr:hypothetical protein Cgig2_017059 [Carnegiea gigantea]
MEQLGKVLKQVQHAVTREVCKKMKTTKVGLSRSGDSNMSQRQDTPRVDILKGMAGEPSDMRNKRYPFALATQKQEAPRKEFRCHLNKCPGKDDKRIRRFHTTPLNILMEIKGNPMLRCPKPIDTLAKFRNKNKYCKYHKDHEHTTVECRELKKALHELIIATIIGGTDGKELSAVYRKAQTWKLSLVLATEELKPLVELTITFDLEDIHPL